MRHLVLYVSEGEMGAPGYLSQLGEDGARNLAESLFQFMAGLGIQLKAAEGQSFQTFHGLIYVKQAIEHESKVLVLSSKSMRSQQTVGIWARHLGLPVVFHDSPFVSEFPESTALAQSPSQQAKQESGIDYILADLFRMGGSESIGSTLLPSLIVVQSPLLGILQWVERTAPRDLRQSIIQSLNHASESDRIPALLAAGLDGPWPGVWLFD